MQLLTSPIKQIIPAVLWTGVDFCFVHHTSANANVYSIVNWKAIQRVLWRKAVDCKHKWKSISREWLKRGPFQPEEVTSIPPPCLGGGGDR